MIPSTNIKFGQAKYTDYQRLDCLGKSLYIAGQGQFGDVYKAKLRENPNYYVAIKYAKLQPNSDQKESPSTIYKEIGFPSTTIREIGILRKLESPYIVKLLDVIKQEKSFHLVFEYINQDLRRYIKDLSKNSKTLERATIKKIMFQLISGLEIIHRNKVMHRDVKPENILIDEQQNIKIADFGLARTYSILNRPYTLNVVTPLYRAPQLLLGFQEYTTAIDLWSAGCIFAELFLGRPLFMVITSEAELIPLIFRTLGTPTEESWLKFSNYIKDLELPYHPNNELNLLFQNFQPDENALNLLNSLLCCNPEKRISAKNALRHPYFEENL